MGWSSKFATTAAGLLAWACAASPAGSDENEGSGGAPAVYPGAGAADPGTSAGGGPTGGGAPGGPGCSGQRAPAERLLGDVFVLMDQSIAMATADGVGGTRWSAATGGLQDFLTAPASAGLGVGIQYFGLGEGGTLFASCNVNDYSLPEVGIATLPANLAALVGSLGRHGPSAKSPSAIALKGALLYARGHKAANPSRSVSLVLVSGAVPDVCRIPGTAAEAMPLADLVGVAAEGASGSPAVPTFVVAVGPGLEALHDVARSGGTGAAQIVAVGADPRGEVAVALGAIRGQSAHACERFLPAMPAGQRLDLTRVNVNVEAPGGVQSLAYVPDAASCGVSAAWHVDDPALPSRVMLCEAACRASEAPGAVVTYELGCPAR